MLSKPCLLHRLDKDTSGIVALARTKRSRRHLVRQFHEHSIVKRYLAVVQRGTPDWAKPRAPFTITEQQEKNMLCSLLHLEIMRLMDNKY